MTVCFKDYLREYLSARPLFLSLIRARELELFAQEFARGGLSRLNSLHPILDVGCGDGFFASVLLAKKFKNSPLRPAEPDYAGQAIYNNQKNIKIDVGLDLPGSRMGEAEKLGVYKKLVEFDGVHIPYKDSSFSTIISNCVLEHVRKLPDLLKEIHRVLKPGGKFITSVMAKPWEENLVGALLLGSSYKSYMSKKQVHLNLFTRNEWRAVFKKAGLRLTPLRPAQPGSGGQGEIGYLSPSACRLIDICHYLSIPNLISYELFGKWVLTPSFPPYPIKWLCKILEEPVKSSKSGAIFYVLEKH